MIIETQARGFFDKAKTKARISRIINILRPERNELLSFYDIRNIVRPKAESYLGMRTVDIDKIIGSEGRYKDFNKAFFPRKEHLRDRWESIAKAHLKDISLPAIKLYKLDNIYFVRDGNHRVSVARTQGIQFIDAEVIELDSEIKLSPEMTTGDQRTALLKYEKNRVLRETGLAQIRGMNNIRFSVPGGFDVIVQHIMGHKHHIEEQGETGAKDIDFLSAAQSWYDDIFAPIVKIIDDNKFLSRFPKRTSADLYFWLVRYWNDKKNIYGTQYSMGEMAKDYSKVYAFPRTLRFFTHLASKKKKHSDTESVSE